MSINTKHWIGHILAIAIIVYLAQLILSAPNEVEQQSSIIKQMQQKNATLRTENDSIKVLAVNLIKQVNAPDPQPEIKIKYISRNEQIEMADNSTLVDAFIAIVQRHRAERLAENNE